MPINAPVMAVLATTFLMASSAATQVEAKERTHVSANLQEKIPAFSAPAIRPLAEAVATGDVARIKAQATTPALSAHGKDNVTLLEWAIWNEKPESLAALLDAGADPAQIGMDQETVAHMAAMINDPLYLEILIQHHAPVDIVSSRGGRTPIFRSVQSRRQAQVELLIKAGADIKRSDSMGNSLLHVAAQVNDAERVLQLLELGLDPAATNSRGETFQAYLFSGSDTRLNAQGRQSRQQVRDWLQKRGIASL